MTYLALMFLTVSQAYHLPPGLLSAICYVESHHDPKAFHHDDGRHNSVGVCQVQLPTARILGFEGSEKGLQQVGTNVRVAATYLSRLLRRYDGDIRKTVSAYNMGTWRVNAEGQTINRKYVAKVFKAWQEDK